MRINSISVAFAAAVLVASTAAQAEEPAGDWLGVLAAPSYGDLSLALRLKKTAAGYEGVLDDITLGARGMPLSAIQATPDRLAFDVPRAHGHYEATWDAAANQWAGVWKSPGAEAGLPLRLARGVPPPAPRAEGLDGDWQGAINAGPAGLLRLVFHIRTDADGTVVTVDSPDQGVAGTPVTEVRRSSRAVAIDMQALKARLDGELSEDGASIQGEFSQGPMLAPVVLKRGGDLPVAPKAVDQGPLPTTWTLPDDAAIRAVLARRIDTEHRGVGIVVGVISPKGRRVIAYGAPAIGDPRKVDGDTLFEIGSITKTFTSLVLSDMALKGEVALDDPVAKYLPAGTVVPSHGGKEITLRELAMHTAALPHDLPPSPTARRPEDMFQATSEADLYKFLATYQLPRDPGVEWEYSNLGMGMVGVAVSRRAGVDFETLVRQRITGPLGMTSTYLATPAALSPRLATGYDAFLHPVGPIAIGPAEAAAGQIRSSANDMLKLLAAETGLTKTPLKPAMDAMLTEDRPGMRGSFRQALGWMLLDFPSGRIVTHSGGTFGQRAFAAFNPKTQTGVVVLTNAEGAAGADDIGAWLIAGVPIRPLPPAPVLAPGRAARPELALSAEAAQPYLGRYRLSPSIFMILGYADGHLTVQAEARGKAGQATPAAWHGGGDFSTSNAGGQAAEMALQLDPAGQAKAFTWRGPAGEFLLRRVDAQRSQGGG